MPFVELTEEGISLLSEEEREQYNKQLEIHKERTAFVEKLEQIENTNYNIEGPKLTRIKPIRKIEILPYQTVGVPNVIMPQSISKIKEMSKYSETDMQRNRNLKERLIGGKVIVDVPNIKVDRNYDISFESQDIRKIKEVDENKVRIQTPNVKRDISNKVNIKEIPVFEKIEVLDIDFKYEKPNVDIKPKKVNIPKKTKYIDSGKITIGEIPVFNLELPKKKEFTIDVSGNTEKLDKLVNEIKGITPATKTELPKVDVKPSVELKTKKMEDIPKVANIEQLCEMGIVKIKDIYKIIPTLHKISPYKAVEINVEEVSVSKPDLPIKFEYQPIDVSVEKSDIMVTELPKQINIVPVEKIEIHKINIPEIRLPDNLHRDFKSVEIHDIPEINVGMQAYTMDEVNSVMSRIIKEI